MKCGKACEVYSRVVGYHRPVKQWNRGKRSEFEERVLFGGRIRHLHRKRGRSIGRDVLALSSAAGDWT
jgi:hypothetical protein